MSPAAAARAARQPGEEMNEMYGVSTTSSGISQESEIIILTYPGLSKFGYLIPTDPGICKSRPRRRRNKLENV